MKRFQLIAIALAFALNASLPALADEAASARSPRFVVNLLDYVAADYSGAVIDGKIASESEYKEQLEFIASALETARMLPETQKDMALQEKIIGLQKLVLSKATGEAVAAQAQSAKADVIRLTGMQMSPTKWPNRTSGAKLYALNCTSCHGVTGHGDGAAGAGMDPKPANFHADSMSSLSAFKAFNTIRVGVPGTGMAAWPQLTDQEVWDLSFYLLALRHENKTAPQMKLTRAQLEKAATLSDEAILASLSGSPLTEDEKEQQLLALRLHSGDQDGGGNTLVDAKDLLKQSSEEYAKGNFDGAKTLALKAYLEGVEPVEPRLRANDPDFVIELEESMAAVRAAIEARAPAEKFAQAFASANVALERGNEILEEKETSPWLAFLIASGILLREGFEAVLVLVAFLAVVRASKSPKAAAWIHGGWIAAVACGVGFWFLSGWLLNISGAQRELMEGGIALLAVVVLLYVGFWLHSKTEMYRWKIFIDQRVKTALAGRNLVGLAAISFLAVFREAFETVLFLRAVWLEAGEASRSALTAGVFGSFAVLLVASWAILKYSAKLPIRRIFSISSVLMILLAVILAGKGVHAIQETGLISVTPTAIRLRLDLLGLYPTQETLIAQGVAALVAAMLWALGRKPTHPRKRVATVKTATEGV